MWRARGVLLTFCIFPVSICFVVKEEKEVGQARNVTGFMKRSRQPSPQYVRIARSPRRDKEIYEQLQNDV